MSPTQSGPIGKLLWLCLGYFLMYVANGMFAKYFTDFLGLKPFEYGFNNTLGSVFVAVIVALVLRWYRMPFSERRWFGPFRLPTEAPYLIMSGICTAVIVPGTTLMYTVQGVSVMVAMVIMRGCIIVVSRMVDAVQQRQGLLKRRIHPAENWAVVFALLGVATNLFYGSAVQGLHLPLPTSTTTAAVNFGFGLFGNTVLVLYVIAYGVRLYWMNYYKNTRGTAPQDNKGYFAIEQITSTVTLILVVIGLLWGTNQFHWTAQRLLDLQAAAHQPNPLAIASGLPYGLIAFLSVFIFMFKGRNASFTGVVNRLTSLLGGVGATLATCWILKGPLPKPEDWAALTFVMIAIYFLVQAEKKRQREMSE